MAANCISYNQGTNHSTFAVTDYNDPADFAMLPQAVGEHGTEDLENYIGRPFDLCIDTSTGDGHWLTPENGWV